MQENFFLLRNMIVLDLDSKKNEKWINSPCLPLAMDSGGIIRTNRFREGEIKVTLPSPGNGQWWNYKNKQILGGRERLRQVCSRAYFVACNTLHFTLYSLCHLTRTVCFQRYSHPLRAPLQYRQMCRGDRSSFVVCLCVCSSCSCLSPGYCVTCTFT